MRWGWIAVRAGFGLCAYALLGCGGPHDGERGQTALDDAGPSNAADGNATHPADDAATDAALNEVSCVDSPTICDPVIAEEWQNTWRRVGGTVGPACGSMTISFDANGCVANVRVDGADAQDPNALRLKNAIRVWKRVCGDITVSGICP